VAVASMTVMQGYCWPLGAPPGQTIEFRTSTGAASYTVTYLRFANRPRDQVTAATVNSSEEFEPVPMMDPFDLAGYLQDTTRTCEQGCGTWSTRFSLVVPADWPSGLYAARCTDINGSTFYVTFVVSPAPAARNSIAVLANTTSWNTYNNWGGYSRYEVNDAARSYQLSQLRPNPEATPIVIDEAPFNVDIAAKIASMPYARAAGMGIDRTTRHMARAEMWLLNWFAEAGYPVDVYTDLDLHLGIADLVRYRALVVGTHPEYWSVPMLTHLDDYLRLGGRLLYLGGNGLYDCVEYPTADLTVMVFSGTTGQRGSLFRDGVRPGSRAESTVLGVQYPGDQDESRAPYEVITSTHRFFRGTGLASGAQFGHIGWSIPVGATGLEEGAASGWETDRLAPQSPANSVLLAAGTNADYPAHMVYHAHAGGGFVFSVGSMSFSGALAADPDLGRIVANVLGECLVPGNWPGVWSDGIDAALAWGNGKAYLFKGTDYVRFNANTDVVDAEYPQPIALRWPRLWDDGIDAAVNWGSGTAYFFKGGEFIAYDIMTGTPHDGYPKAIAGSWPGLWADGVDAAVLWNPDVAYFFRNDEYVRVAVASRTVEDGYPRPIADNWPGLWTDGVDAAVNWGNGKAYFFKGSEYVRYDVVSGTPDPGYPVPIA
jgi:hypothetical protein